MPIPISRTTPCSSPWQRLEGAPEPGTYLCSVSALDVTGAKGIDFENEGKRFSMFLATDGISGVQAFVNRCPHAGTPLDILPDRFLTRNRDAIICSTHGACFRIPDGFCFTGPCRGRSLLSVPIEIEGAAVRISHLPCDLEAGNPGTATHEERDYE